MGSSAYFDPTTSMFLLKRLAPQACLEAYTVRMKVRDRFVQRLHAQVVLRLTWPRFESFCHAVRQNLPPISATT